MTILKLLLQLRLMSLDLISSIFSDNLVRVRYHYQARGSLWL